MTTAATIDTASAWEAGRRFRRVRQAGRQLILIGADVAAFVTADLLLRWGKSVPELQFFPAQWPAPAAHTIQVDAFLSIAVLFIIVRYLAGDYSRRLLFWDSARLTTKSLLVAALPDFFLLIAGNGLYSPFAIASSWLLLLITIPAFRQIARVAMFKFGLWKISSVLIGAGERAGDIYNALSNSLSLGFDLQTVMSTDSNCTLPTSLSALKCIVVSDADDAVRRVQQSGCEQAVIAAGDVDSPQFSDIVQRFLEADIAVAIVPSLRRLPLVGLSTGYFFGQDILLLQVRNNLRQLPRRILKRSFDILGATILLGLLSPVFAVIAFAIRRADGGPALYSHRRVGRNREPFDCLKFRTMAVDADERLDRWRDENPALYEEFLKSFKLRDDPRVTEPGKWLRRTSLDELPQLINVLRGEMSLVGPRPVVELELQNYYGPAAQLYCRVRPGMTGLWQVSGRSDTSYEERVTYDEWYILNWTFWYDLVILLQTAWIVASGKGAF